MKASHVLVVIFISLTMYVGANKLFPPEVGVVTSDTSQESAYERIMRTGKLKCGYGIGKPWIYQDKSGEIIGITVDVMNEIAKYLSLELEWGEETGWANLPTSLINGRVDVACSTLWADPARGKQVAFTDPIYYNVLHAYSREDDSRFTGSMEELNKPEIRIAVQEGDFTYSLSKRLFPKATLEVMPSMMSGAELMLNVSTNKADVTIIDPVSIKNFNDNQEKDLKRVPISEPLAIYSSAFATSIYEHELNEMIDTAVKHMINTGKMEEITAEFRKEYPDAILLTKRPGQK